jgi:hypothetical protein
MVILAQAVGLYLIFLALHLLEAAPDPLLSVANKLVALGLAMLLLVLCCWYNSLINVVYGQITQDPEPFVSRVKESTRKTRIVTVTLALVVVDTLLLGTLILLTGGLGRSPLDPLLPVIPTIAIILRLPGRTVKLAITMQLLFTALLFFHWFVEAHQWLSHRHFWLRLVYDAHKDNKFVLAFTVVAAGSVGLSILEYYITHGWPPLVIGIGAVVRSVGGSVPGLKERLSAVRQGALDWIGWLDLQGLPRKDFSIVHDDRNVARQAVILSLPYWCGEATGEERKRITRRIAFLTYAAHWIDDHFDPITINLPDPDEELRQSLQTCGPDDLLNSEPRLQQLLRRMKKLAPKDQQEYIQRAVLRVFYGALIQNAATEERLTQLLNDYVDYVLRVLPNNFRQAYSDILTSSRKLSLLATTKVVIELLDCCASGFSPISAADSGFVFGWDNTGALRLTVEKSTTNMRVATSGGAAGPGPWMQVAFTWDGTPSHGTAADAHLFLNGVEQPKASAADGSGTLGFANATNQPFRIGNASYDPMAGSLNGKMAYLAIYKARILTPTEMNQLDAGLPIA